MKQSPLLKVGSRVQNNLTATVACKFYLTNGRPCVPNRYPPRSHVTVTPRMIQLPYPQLSERTSIAIWYKIRTNYTLTLLERPPNGPRVHTSSDTEDYLALTLKNIVHTTRSTEDNQGRSQQERADTGHPTLPVVCYNTYPRTAHKPDGSLACSRFWTRPLMFFVDQPVR